VNLYVQSQGAQARIQQELSRRLGTPIRIRSISVTPWGGLTLTGITIPQVSSVTTTDFLEARSFHLHVRLLPLFSRRLVIKEVSLLGPNVVWPQNEKGKWRLPGSQAEEEPGAEVVSNPAPSPEPEAESTATPSNLTVQTSPSHRRGAKAETVAPSFAPELRRMNVTNGNFRFLDRSGGSVATFENVRFHSYMRNSQAVRGSVTVARIGLRDRVFLQSFQSSLHYDMEELSLPGVTAHSGTGDLTGQFTIQPQATDSPFSVTAKFHGVSADEIVTDAGGPKGVIQGKLEGNFEANGKGADATALNGHGEIFLRDGQLQQYSILVALGQILQIEELTQLQLQQAEVKFHIDPGVVIIDRLVLRSPNIRLSATGTVNFNGKLNLDSQLAINDKVRSQLFSPIRDNFQPIDEPGLSAVDFKVSGSVDRPKTNLMEKVVGKNLKDIMSGLFGGGNKPEKPKRKHVQEAAPDLSPEPSKGPTLNPDALTTPP
jgi:uncharacterized protein involved in outer membrane biogenesis